MNYRSNKTEKKIFKAGWVKYMLLLVALAFIIYGIRNGEHVTVWRKAVNICLECIGI